MPVPLRSAAIAAFLAIALPGPTAAAPITAEAIETAVYTGGPLPTGQDPLTVKVQVLLDRAGISPGVIDGIKGGMSRSAIAAFERRSGLSADGMMDEQVWTALQSYAGTALTMDYTITETDATNLTRYIPTDYLEKANMTTLGYTSVAEKLAERFHMDEKFVATLNPGVPLVAGSVIKVIAPSKPQRAKVTRILVEKGTNRVAAFDAGGHMVVNYPATIGSAQTPSPSGTHTVRAVALNPEYTYNPAINFTQGENRSVLTLPPGPNGPVGSVWIALSAPTYGLHGTATPSRLFVNESYGCVRLTNWDAEELAHMVQPGVTTVEFLERGTSLADVMGQGAVTAPAAATMTGTVASAPLVLTASTRPMPRPAHMVQPPAMGGGAVPGLPSDTIPAAAATVPAATMPAATMPAANTAAEILPPAETVPAPVPQLPAAGDPAAATIMPLPAESAPGGR